MSQTWSFFTTVTLLAVHLCIGQKSCSIWSSTGPDVQRDSCFQIYCQFNCKCKGSMYSDQSLTPESHSVLNSTTIYLNVVNITKSRTYSCQCKCPIALDPCGLDISAGYPPEQPKNISCIYKVMNGESGDVYCTWNRGRATHLRDSMELWVRTPLGESERHSVSKGTNLLSVSFTVPRSARLIHVWVRAQNPLGSAVSSTATFSLSDIASPTTPVLGRAVCSSRECIIRVEQSVRTRHLEIQYTSTEQTWTSHPDQSELLSTVQGRSISSLQPYRFYHFRARSKFSSGLWSQWSTNISSWTQEEAPAKELDVWYVETASDSKPPRVYWKEASISNARGKIIEYKVRVYNHNSGSEQFINVSSDARKYSVPIRANCEVTVWARNSKGLSPPARITTHRTKAQAFQDVRINARDHNVTLSWRKPDSAPLPVALVVEWYPEGQKLEELRWLRLGRNDNRTLLTGIEPFECYEGALYAFYNKSSVGRTPFKAVTTLELAPEAGPVVQGTVEGHTVNVTWMMLPRSQRRGCITNYTIYVENNGHRQHYSIPASERMFMIKELSPALYSLWMSASTAAGEGPVGKEMKFLIQSQEILSLSLFLVCVFVSLIGLLLVCVCQSSTVKRRFWVFFQCLMLDVVPDPANSKWAKECTQEKGKMELRLHLSNSSVNQGEEEPVVVDVEELLIQKRDIPTSTNIFTQQHPQIRSTESEPTTPLYPLTTYLKSFSHDSDGSGHTQTSLDTGTLDYTSSHALGNMEEEDPEEDMVDFFPSHSDFIEPLNFGGKLTLDLLKIDFGSDFFQNS